MKENSRIQTLIAWAKTGDIRIRRSLAFSFDVLITQLIPGTIHPTLALISLPYFIYFLAKKGATPGKQLLFLKVETIEGKPLMLYQAIARVMAQFLFGFPILLQYVVSGSLGSPAFLAVSALLFVGSHAVALTNKQHRTLHDYVSNTVVHARKI